MIRCLLCTVLSVLMVGAAVLVLAVISTVGCVTIETTEGDEFDVEHTALVVSAGMELATRESLAAIEHEATLIQVRDYLDCMSAAAMAAFGSTTSTLDSSKEKFAMLMEDSAVAELSVPGMLGWFVDQTLVRFPELTRWGPAAKLAISIIEAMYDPAVVYPEDVQMLAYAFFSGIHNGLR